MNDEIKKIIQSISDFYKLDNALKYYLDRHKAQILLDYITNLQKENERLKNDVEDISCSHFSLFKSYEDYKSRVEKAVEYIKEHPTNMWYSVEKPNEDFREVKIIKHQEDLLNILQNGSDDNV